MFSTSRKSFLIVSQLGFLEITSIAIAFFLCYTCSKSSLLFSVFQSQAGYRRVQLFFRMMLNRYCQLPEVRWRVWWSRIRSSSRVKCFLLQEAMFKTLARGLQVNEEVAARELEGKGRGQEKPRDGHSGVT